MEMNQMFRKFKDERGALVLEATYIIALAIIILAVFIAYGFFLYQNTMVNYAANQIAEEISQTYKYRYVENGQNITVSDITSLGRYRYLGNGADFQSANVGKAEELLTPRLALTSLAREGSGGVSVELEPKMADLGRMYYTITVTKNYRFLFHDFLNKLAKTGGYDRDIGEIKTTVVVDGMDASYYINNVKFAKWATNKLEDNTLDKAITTLNTVLSWFGR